MKFEMGGELKREVVEAVGKRVRRKGGNAGGEARSSGILDS